MRRIALVRPQPASGNDADLATHAIQLFDSVLWFSKGSTRCDWSTSPPEQADVVVAHHAESAHHLERWQRDGKLVVLISTDRAAAVEHPHRLQYPFPAAQVLTLLDQLDAALGGSAPAADAQDARVTVSESGRGDPWSFVETLRILRSVSNPDLWLMGKSAGGHTVWVRGDGACYACDDASAIRSGALALQSVTLHRAAPPGAGQVMRSGAELAWFAAYHASPTIAPWLKASAHYRLKRWPDFGRLRALAPDLRSEQIRVAAAIEPSALGVQQAAARAKVAPELAVRMFNALAMCNLIETEAVAVTAARAEQRVVSAAEELKIVFTGPMGAGKTTAISVVSDCPPVRTEVGDNDQEGLAKTSTTVALDLGQLRLDNGTVVRLYGTPGQVRSSLMWEDLGRGAIGFILLLDGSSPDMCAQARTYAEVFRRVAPDQPLLVGIGRTSSHDDRALDAVTAVLAEMGCIAPVLSVDVRRRDDVLLIIDILLAMLEARIAEGGHDVH